MSCGQGRGEEGMSYQRGRGEEGMSCLQEG